MCLKCQSEKPHMEMDKSRRSCCKDCNAAYKALAARWGKQRSLKADAVESLRPRARGGLHARWAGGRAGSEHRFSNRSARGGLVEAGPASRPPRVLLTNCCSNFILNWGHMFTGSRIQVPGSRLFVGKGFVGRRFVGRGFVGRTFVGRGFVRRRFVGRRFVGRCSCV